MNKNNIKGLIFDYGATLDTCGCHWGQMIRHAYERNAIPVSEEQFREAYVYAERTLGSNPIIQSRYTFYKTLQIKIRIEMEYIKEHNYWTPSEADLDQAVCTVVDDLYARVKTYAHVSVELLTLLKKKFRIVLVSNFYGNISVVLHEFGFDGIFEKIIESAVVGIRKPDPRIYMLGVNTLQMKPEEVTIIGDSFKKDIMPAKKIGCNAIWIKGETWTDENNDESLPDAIITDLGQLTNILNSK
jgi:HAD superfamily hydrolase (TIGR01549 family)